MAHGHFPSFRSPRNAMSRFMPCDWIVRLAVVSLATGLSAVPVTAARPSMGHAGGMGGGRAATARPQARPAARPQMPHPQVQRPQPRPAMPQARPANAGGMQQRPAFQRPSVGSFQQPNPSRPSLPNAGVVARPAPGPGFGAGRPGLGAVRPTPGPRPAPGGAGWRHMSGLDPNGMAPKTCRKSTQEALLLHRKHD